MSKVKGNITDFCFSTGATDFDKVEKVFNNYNKSLAIMSSSIVNKDAYVNTTALARTDVRYLFNAFVKERGSYDNAVSCCKSVVNNPNNFADVSDVRSVSDIVDKFAKEVSKNQLKKEKVKVEAQKKNIADKVVDKVVEENGK